MNRQEFMTQLSGLLMDIDEQERAAALEYYEDYFDDAGIENEAAVILELESPQKVADTMKASLGTDESHQGEYTEHGYEDARFREKKQTPEKVSDGKKQEDEWKEAKGPYVRSPYDTEQNRNTGKSSGFRSWMLLLVIFAFPLLLVVFGAVFGIIGGVVGILTGTIGAVAGAVANGMVLIVRGIGMMLIAPATGLIQFGSGLLLMAVGIVLIVAIVIVCVKWLPQWIRRLTNWGRNVLHHRK